MGDIENITDSVDYKQILYSFSSRKRNFILNTGSWDNSILVSRRFLPIEWVHSSLTMTISNKINVWKISKFIDR